VCELTILNLANRRRKGETVMAKRRKRKRSSRPIVSGYLEKVSANIFDSFKEAITAMIAGHQGVYAL